MPFRSSKLFSSSLFTLLMASTSLAIAASCFSVSLKPQNFSQNFSCHSTVMLMIRRKWLLTMVPSMVPMPATLASMPPVAACASVAATAVACISLAMEPAPRPPAPPAARIGPMSAS